MEQTYREGKRRKPLDVLIIGGGIVGTAVARELSRYTLTIGLAEAASDLARKTTGANSGIIHAGYDAPAGSLMAKLNVQGNQMYPKLCRDLDIPFVQNGSLVLAFTQEDQKELQTLFSRGQQNGVEGLAIVSGDEVRKREPHISQEVVEALYAPTAGVISPYEAAIAFAENAADNGVEFYLGHPVTSIAKTPEGFLVTAGGQEMTCKVLINCAGFASDEISRMAEGESLAAQARKGEYILYDKAYGDFVNHVIFQPPGKMGKGVLVTRTAEGNLLVGPSSETIYDPEDTATTQQGLDLVWNTARKSCPTLPAGGAITTFTGIRSVYGDDFYIRHSDLVPGLIQTAGICSPGLTAAPAIAKTIASLTGDLLPLEEKAEFQETREGIPVFSAMSWEEREALIRQDPAYARMVCRCETVTEGQIRRALHSPVPVWTVDGVKRRVRAGMGRCQGSFCTPRVMEIIEEETGIPFSEITKNGKGSELITGKLKETEGGASHDSKH